MYSGLDSFTRAYLECALWSTNDESTPEGGVPFDKNYNIMDLSKASLDTAICECEAFQQQNAELLMNAGTDEQNGHDFWLTRNRHGAGFWCRDYDNDTATALTDAAHSHGERDLYLGDDGEIHFS